MTLPTEASLASTPDERRPWAAPRLTSHDSMTVLTQSVLGVVDAVLLLQIGGSTGGIGGGGPNGQRAPSGPVTPQGGASGPPVH